MAKEPVKSVKSAENPSVRDFVVLPKSAAGQLFFTFFLQNSFDCFEFLMLTSKKEHEI